jgi:flagellar hook protein FlgE
VASIVNGLFSGRSGISAHGAAIAVLGDNIANANTLGFKAARAEFEDLIAGGQASGRVIGAGSSVSSVSSIFQQGTLEFSGRSLDLAVDGNGYFAVLNQGQRFYTRAGNFTVNSSGFIVNQDGLQVLGFPANGTGTLEPININTVSQDSVSTTRADISANLDARADAIAIANVNALAISQAGTIGSTATYADLNALAEFNTTVTVFDQLGDSHEVTLFYFKTGANTWNIRAYVNSEDVDPSGTATGIPRQIGPAAGFTLAFNPDGTRATPTSATGDIQATNIPWNNGSATTQDISFHFDSITQYASPSNPLSISQDGKGIGTVGSLSIEKNGDVFALLDNGQAAVIGTIGLVNFSNPEGLVRIGSNLLQQSPSSGEPVVGRPQSGTFGAVQSGAIELSTVDIANEFVKLIQLQRGFQANSRIITTINQLLNEIIQLA